MDSKLERFLKLIDFDEENYSCFFDAKITNVKVSLEHKSWSLYIKIGKMISIDLYKDLISKSKNIKNVKKVNFYFAFDDENGVFAEYFDYYFGLLREKYPMLNTIKNEDIIRDGNIININVLNKIEADKIDSLKDEIVVFLKSVGFFDISIESVISEELQSQVKELFKTNEVIKVEEKKSNEVIFGNLIKGKSVSLKSIIAEVNDVILEVFVFGVEEKETNSGFTIFTLKISDYSDSIYAKIFTKDKDVVNKIRKDIKVSSWYKMRGYVKHDNFANDLVFNIRDIMSVDRKSEKRVDNAVEKRVELHVHTVMSQMDGLIRWDKLLKKIGDFGHRAVGVTDKNSVQAFPKLYKNKGDIKVLFGAEIFLVDDEFKIINKETDEDLRDSTYVVFDLETTGFNAEFDSIIEIGAVKIKNGEIIDRFDELINPNVELRSEIIELTHITDDMLKDKRSEEEVVCDFIKWFGYSPMVAQNARFDVSFLTRAYRKYNLGSFNNTVIDTMELSKVLSPDMHRHSLSALVKRWGVEFDEEAHHRADYDAEATAKVLYKMISSLDSSFKLIRDLNKLVDVNTAVKNNKPYHITVFAKNNDGLKNLFRIISFANTDYFYKTPRMPKSKLIELKEGLLIGSGCVNGEIFNLAKTQGEDELINAMNLYDFIELNPPSICDFLIESGEFTNPYELKETMKKIIKAADKIGKPVVATGDVHTLDPEDNIYREILVAQKQSGGGFHPLNKPSIKHIPNAYLMNTEEMLKEFEFLGEEKAYEIVVKNSNMIADIPEEIEVIKKDLYPPKMENSANIVRDMVYGNARKIYGEVLPEIIETRLDKEVGGIISGGYDVMYLIAQKLVQNSNEHGYMVGSRGSVGSSLVATFMNITEVNPLPPHYVCPNCKKSIFELDGESLAMKYGSGFDMPDRICECGTKMKKDGQDIPFETFLGFNADKTPDIDLNFSGEYQARAHEYTKVLFGEHNVYRAGTVSTIAEKTAYGFVKAYMEEKGITMRRPEIERLAGGITKIKRTSGQHPGGIIVIPAYKDVFDFTPYQYPAENPEADWYTTHFEFHDIEENVLKLDILGHDDPTVLKYLCDDVNVDINDIPLDDRDVLSLFTSPKALGVTSEELGCPTGTWGVPEFGTNFAIKMLTEIMPTKFADLIKIAGLAHGTDVWAGNARDLLLSGTCTFDQVIGCRDDIMIYLIKCGIDKGKAFKISEFIRKGKTAKEPDTWKEHKEVLKSANVPDWYINSCEKIKYMFPKAHASAYVTNGFRVAWFKVHHPINYYRVFLSIRKSDFDIEAMLGGINTLNARIKEIDEKGFDASVKEEAVKSTLEVAKEMVLRGFKFENISLTKSDATMFVLNENKDGLYPPFTVLDGMGDTAAKKLVEERNIKPFVSIEDVQYRGKVSQTLIDKMRGLGVFAELPESSQLSLDLFSNI